MHPVVAIPTCEIPQACNSIRENTFCLDDGRNGRWVVADAVAVAVLEKRKRRDVLLAQRLFECRCH